MANEIGFIGARRDFKLSQGASFGPVLIDVIDKNGVPLDLSEYEFVAFLKKTWNSKTIAANLLCTVVALGQFELSMIPSESIKLTCGETENDAASKYQYEIRLRLIGSGPTPIEHPLYSGQFSIFRNLSATLA